jgi:hypothetical protein
MLAGCVDQQIEHYRVARTGSPARGGTGQARLLAAVFPRSDRTWFFKLTGPASLVDREEERFREFVRSVRFPETSAEPVRWDLPSGWKSEPGTGMRYATIRLGSDGPGLELSVTPLEGASGSMLANVNRWRDQLGLAPIAASELEKACEKLPADGPTGQLVDLKGSLRPGNGMGPRPPGSPTREASRGATGRGLTYQVPTGWKELPAGGMRLAAFRVTDGEKTAETTVVRLGGPGGGLEANINRWRGQIGLPPLAAGELQQDIRQVDVGGAQSPYIDIDGPGAAGAGATRVLAVAVAKGEQTWFFKMTGPPGLVAREKSAFESLLRSVKFDGD